MEQSIDKMKNILNQHMIVEIYQSADNSDNIPQARVNGNIVDYNTPHNNDESNVSSNQSSQSSPSLPNPENENVKLTDKKINNTTKLNEDGMTFMEFKNYMENEFIEHFRNSG